MGGLLSDNRTPADLIGRRAIVFGGDTALGRALAAALRDAGALVGVTGTTTDGQALFALKRAAAGGPAEATDLANPTSVRVATKKLRKALGGLDLAALVLHASTLERSAATAAEPLRIAAKEIARGAGADASRVVLIVAEADPAGAAPRFDLRSLLNSVAGVTAVALLVPGSPDAQAVGRIAVALLMDRGDLVPADAVVVEAAPAAAGGSR